MRLKDNSVSIDGCSHNIVYAMSVVAQIYDYWGHELVITSGSEKPKGKLIHKKNSLHYKGQAFDSRIFYFKSSDLDAICKEMSFALGDDYDVVLELDKVHFHIEYDPK